MSIRRFTLSVLAVLWLCSTSAFAQVEQWQGHMDAATTAYQYHGRYADAEPLYERSLAILEKALGPEHPEVATSLNNLA